MCLLCSFTKNNSFVLNIAESNVVIYIKLKKLGKTEDEIDINQGNDQKKLFINK